MLTTQNAQVELQYITISRPPKSTKNIECELFTRIKMFKLLCSKSFDSNHLQESVIIIQARN